MTKEEAIEELSLLRIFQDAPNLNEAVKMAVAALQSKMNTSPNDPLTQRALGAVAAERKRQDTLWGDQSGNSLFEWVSILGEEYGELCEAVNETSFSNPTHPDRGGFEAIIKEDVQVAAVAVAITEAAYRRKPEEVTIQ